MLTLAGWSAWLEWIKDFFSKKFAWFKSVPVWFWGILTTFVFAPLGKIIDFLRAQVAVIRDHITELGSLIDGLHFGDWGGYWAAVIDAAMICNVFVPLELAFALISVLIALWGVCFLIKIAFKLKAIIWGS